MQRTEILVEAGTNGQTRQFERRNLKTTRTVIPRSMPIIIQLNKMKANTIDYTAFFKNELDAFPTIDNEGFALLHSATGQKLKTIRNSVFLSGGVRSNYLDGDLELAFEECKTFNCTMGHDGVRVFPGELTTDADEHDGMQWIVEPLKILDMIVGNTCLDIRILLEPVGLYGYAFLTSAILFRFSNCSVGYEEFSHAQQSERSNILVAPDWSDYKSVGVSEIIGR